MNDNGIRSAPDYKNAALTMLGINLAWIFLVIWAVIGLGAVLVLSLLLNHVITRIALRSATRDAACRPRDLSGLN